MTTPTHSADASPQPAAVMPTNKWRSLLLLAVAELLAMVVWFSASAVIPALTDAWQLSPGQQAWLTMSVQIGFVVGALLSAIFTLADRLPARYLFPASAFLAGFATLLIPLAANGITLTLILRFLTGVFLAGVYPVGMKIMASWTNADSGLGIGLRSCHRRLPHRHPLCHRRPLPHANAPL